MIFRRALIGLAAALYASSAIAASNVTIVDTNSVPMGTAGNPLNTTASVSLTLPTANRVVLVPTIQNASYVSGNCVGGFNAVTIAVTNGETGLIPTVAINSIAGLATAITVYLFDSNPSASTCTDKSTFTLNSADVSKLITPPFALTPAAPTGTTSSFAAQTFTPPPAFIAGGATNSGVKTIYVALVMGGTVTPASTTDLQVSIGFIPVN